MHQLLNMLGRKKLKVLTWCATSLFLLQSCTNPVADNSALKDTVQRIQGETQGTTYGIQVIDGPQIFKSDIDSILHDFDMSLSGYIAESTVSKFNAVSFGYVVPFEDKYFMNCFNMSKALFKKTEGAFDPTVLPLMNLWGFLKKTDHIPAEGQIDSVLNFTGFSDENIMWMDPTTVEMKGDWNDGHHFSKRNSNVQLDFNAIAQGYSVDVVADYLKSKGCKNLYVEIGGEIYVEGENPDGNSWRLGVDKPVAENTGKNQRVISEVIEIAKGGVATSGNYRKFYEKEGKIYAHTINPKTGRPAENEILSATVVAKTAAEADGIATAFMVMGLEKTKDFLRSSDLDVLIIYTNDKNDLQSWTTEGMKKRLL